MKIPTETYEIKYKNYYLALEWLANIGVNLGSGRTKNYEKCIRFWKDNYKDANKVDEIKILPAFVNAMHEINDFVDIYLAFKDVSKSELSDLIVKLQKSVHGPIELSSETESSNTARNFLFEATLTAKMHKPEDDIYAILDAQSDSGVKVNDRKIWIECKRVTNIEKIRPNVRKARNQLEKIFKLKLGSSHRGIIAIDVTKIINPENDIYVTRNDQVLVYSVQKKMDDFIKENNHVWQNVIEGKNKIVAIIIRFSFMATSESRNLLVHTSEWGVNTRIGISDSEQSTLEYLTTAINK
ncbi:hypothetical protein [Endozoicomonas ascidiicola]|uniref:hypothetical protein n=1 Tax=Endozoicomonas ascidiicola TaxID=1698521 RepID=UPI00082F99BA|nr:hypothetical protein [Endozoicomonas ascidiicola]